DFRGLEGRGLERGASDMPGVRVARESHDRAARTGVPVGRIQPRERGHEVYAAVVVDARGEILDVRAALDQDEIVAQPLPDRARVGDRALERVSRRLVAEAISEGREE